MMLLQADTWDKCLSLLSLWSLTGIHHRGVNFGMGYGYLTSSASISCPNMVWSEWSKWPLYIPQWVVSLWKPAAIPLAYNTGSKCLPRCNGTFPNWPIGLHNSCNCSTTMLPQYILYSRKSSQVQMFANLQKPVLTKFSRFLISQQRSRPMTTSPTTYMHMYDVHL